LCVVWVRVQARHMGDGYLCGFMRYADEVRQQCAGVATLVPVSYRRQTLKRDLRIH